MKNRQPRKIQKMTVDERRSIEEQIREHSDILEQREVPLAGTDTIVPVAQGRDLQSREKMDRQVRRGKFLLERDADLIARGRQKDDLWREKKELERELREHMPSQNEMWRKDGTTDMELAVRKNLEFHRRFGEKAQRWKDISRRLEPENPRADDMERIRPQ